MSNHITAGSNVVSYLEACELTFKEYKYPRTMRKVEQKPIPLEDLMKEALMESEKPYIEILRNCKSREEVIQFFEEESHNEIQYWPDSAYEHAAEMLNEAQGSPECHYTSCDGPITPQVIFEAQICTLLAGTWKYTLEVQKAQEALKKTEKYDWIDFDEKKPEEKDEYLVSSNSGKRSVDIWLGTFFLGHPSGVDYWMPLPPAKAKEKKDERRR